MTPAAASSYSHRQPSDILMGSAPIQMALDHQRSPGTQRKQNLMKLGLQIGRPVGSVINITKTGLKFGGSVLGTCGFLCIGDIGESKRFGTYALRYGAKTVFKVARLGATLVTVGPYAAGYLCGVAVPAVGRATERTQLRQEMIGWRIQNAIETTFSHPNLGVTKFRVGVLPYEHLDVLRDFELLQKQGEQIDAAAFSRLATVVVDSNSDGLDVLNALELVDVTTLNDAERVGMLAVSIATGALDEVLQRHYEELLGGAPDRIVTATKLLDYWYFTKDTVPNEMLERLYADAVADGRSQELLEQVAQSCPRVMIALHTLDTPEVKTFLGDRAEGVLANLSGQDLERYLRGLSPSKIKEVFPQLKPAQRDELFKARHILDGNNPWQIGNKIPQLDLELSLILIPLIPVDLFRKLMPRLSLLQHTSILKYSTDEQIQEYVKRWLVPASTGLLRWIQVKAESYTYEAWIKTREPIRKTLEKEQILFSSLIDVLEDRSPEIRIKITDRRVNRIRRTLSDMKRMTKNLSDHDSESEVICPITQCPIEDSVTDHHGHSFEREAIHTWLKAHKTCPVSSGESLTISNLEDTPPPVR